MTRPLAIIEDVLEGRFIVEETGRPLLTSIRDLVIAPSLAGREAELVRGVGLASSLAVVADENTVEVMGRRVAAALSGAQLVVLERPKADEATVQTLLERTRHAQALVATGSGTLNDLCKHVTHATGRPCAVFATAPSMDGYVSTTVSITKSGFKTSLPAHAPVGVFFDLGVLAAAPARMIRAGLGDTICRTTAQVDWLLSHLLLGTTYAETPYHLMREDEPRLYAQADRLLDRDLDAMLALTRLLVLSGLGVLVTGTSHCGSMGEHSISHYLDMFAKPHPGSLHGEQVGLATWTMARLQGQILASETAPELRPLPDHAVGLERRYGRFADMCRAACAEKPFDPAGAQHLNGRLARDWQQIRERLRAVMLPLQELRQVIETAGLAASPAALGFAAEPYREAVAHAHEIRDRYGFLDLAAQAGLLAGFAAEEG